MQVAPDSQAAWASQVLPPAPACVELENSKICPDLGRSDSVTYSHSACNRLSDTRPAPLPKRTPVDADLGTIPNTVLGPSQCLPNAQAHLRAGKPAPLFGISHRQVEHIAFFWPSLLCPSGRNQDKIRDPVQTFSCEPTPSASAGSESPQLLRFQAQLLCHCLKGSVRQAERQVSVTAGVLFPRIHLRTGYSSGY